MERARARGEVWGRERRGQPVRVSREERDARRERVRRRGRVRAQRHGRPRRVLDRDQGGDLRAAARGANGDAHAGGAARDEVLRDVAAVSRHALAVDRVSGRLENFPTSPVSEFSSAAKDACAWEWDDVVARMDGKDENTAIDRLPGRCFDGVLAEALLTAADDDEGDGRRRRRRRRRGKSPEGSGSIDTRRTSRSWRTSTAATSSGRWARRYRCCIPPRRSAGARKRPGSSTDGARGRRRRRRAAAVAARAAGGGGGGGGAASFFALVAVGGVVWYAATRGSGRGGTLSKSASGTLRGRP